MKVDQKWVFEQFINPGTMNCSKMHLLHIHFTGSKVGPPRTYPEISLRIFTGRMNPENWLLLISTRICRIKLWNRPLSKIGANINGRDCFCDSSCQDFRDCCSDHAETCPELTTKKTSQQTTTAITTLSTTKKPKNTRPPTIKDESWIFDKLFESLQNIIDEKFGKSTKYQNFIDRLENTRFYFLNAEHNCRFNKECSHKNGRYEIKRSWW